jgi:glycosyltransferase involved in cell wall biosynthesis
MHKPARICFLPGAPEEGAHSMDHYWRELESCARSSPLNNAELTNVFSREAPRHSRRASRLHRAFNKYLAYPWRVKQMKNVQLFHLLDHSYANVLPSVSNGARVVATVFDLVPLRDPDSLRCHQVDRFRHVVKNLRCADALIAVSKETAKDLETMLGIAPGRIQVIYPGTNLEKFGQPVRETGLLKRLPSGKRILLSVGSTEPRKNLDSIAEIFPRLVHRFRQGEWIFVRVGALLPYQTEKAISDVIGSENFLQLGSIAQDDVVSIFQNASVFLFPSVLEGFSFTMMEAMAAGLPVVANRMSTNPEVGQDAVAYYENGDYDTAARAIQQVLDNQSYANQLREAGFVRIKALTWANHWEGVKSVYRELLADRHRFPK